MICKYNIYGYLNMIPRLRNSSQMAYSKPGSTLFYLLLTHNQIWQAYNKHGKYMTYNTIRSCVLYICNCQKTFISMQLWPNLADKISCLLYEIVNLDPMITLLVSRSGKYGHLGNDAYFSYCPDLFMSIMHNKISCLRLQTIPSHHKK